MTDGYQTLDEELVALHRDTRELCEHLEHVAPEALDLARAALARRKAIETGIVDQIVGSLLPTHLGAGYVADRLRIGEPGEVLELSTEPGEGVRVTLRVEILAEDTESPQSETDHD
jgi:hypothetical protein